MANITIRDLPEATTIQDDDLFVVNDSAVDKKMSKASLRTDLGVEDRLIALNTGDTAGTAATADVTTSATDTTPGRVLKVGDFGLGATAVSTSINDANNFTETGWYIATGTSVANLPLNSNRFLLYHINRSGDYQSQTAYLSDGTGQTIYYRRENNGVWGPWIQQYTQANILGTVSQSGGVPTGAIIERGSYSAVGSTLYWEKTAGGKVFASILIPKDAFGPSTDFNSVAQGIIIYRSELVSIDVSPLNFIRPPSVGFIADGGLIGSRILWARSFLNSATAVTVQFQSLDSFFNNGLAYQNINVAHLFLSGEWY